MTSDVRSQTGRSGALSLFLAGPPPLPSARAKISFRPARCATKASEPVLCRQTISLIGPEDFQSVFARHH